MLTTDMCIAYRNNRKFIDCNFATWKSDFWKGGHLQNHWQCGVNFFDQSEDLDPLASNCCTWTKLVPLNAMNVIDYINVGVTDYCGVPFWK